LPYRYAFGANQQNPVEYDLAEPARFLELCSNLGVKIVNLSAGSPYYNPHINARLPTRPPTATNPPTIPLSTSLAKSMSSGSSRAWRRPA